MLNKTILATILLLTMVNQVTATIPVNETVGAYRISFEVGDNTSFIAKGWNLQNNGEFLRMSDALNVTEILGVGTLNITYSPTEYSAVGVLILDKPVNTTDFETEFLSKITSSYVRAYDRTIDGHKGIYALSGNGPEDSNMARIGLYWLDEADNGMAKELVLILNFEPTLPEIHGSESTMVTILKTVHVEKF